MFTGIIADVGSIKSVKPREGGGLRLKIKTDRLDLSDVALGDSIAVNGVCLTVVKLADQTFSVEVSKLTLDCTVGLADAGLRVNLEKALRLADRLGGHLVSGHVDGVGSVEAFADLGESWKLSLRAPNNLAKYLATKGSVTVNGVSLTVNEVVPVKKTGEAVFSLNLIPHTLAMTTLGDLCAGARVNLEVDLIARYVERMRAAEVELG